MHLPTAARPWRATSIGASSSIGSAVSQLPSCPTRLRRHRSMELLGKGGRLKGLQGGPDEGRGWGRGALSPPPQTGGRATVETALASAETSPRSAANAESTQARLGTRMELRLPLRSFSPCRPPAAWMAGMYSGRLCLSPISKMYGQACKRPVFFVLFWPGRFGPFQASHLSFKLGSNERIARRVAAAAEDQAGIGPAFLPPFSTSPRSVTSPRLFFPVRSQSPCPHCSLLRREPARLRCRSKIPRGGSWC